MEMVANILVRSKMEYFMELEPFIIRKTRKNGGNFIDVDPGGTLFLSSPDFIEMNTLGKSHESNL